jgi:hypothetical protein
MMSTSLAQRSSALRRANLTRALRADARRNMTRERAGDLVMSPEDWALTWSCASVLAAVPGIGEVRVRRALRRGSVSVGQTLGELRREQRESLHGELLGHAPTT